MRLSACSTWPRQADRIFEQVGKPRIAVAVAVMAFGEQARGDIEVFRRVEG